MKKKNAKKGKTGPKPEVLKIEGNWRDAVRRGLAKGKPPKEAPKKQRRAK